MKETVAHLQEGLVVWVCEGGMSLSYCYLTYRHQMCTPAIVIGSNRYQCASTLLKIDFIVLKLEGPLPLSLVLLQFSLTNDRLNDLLVNTTPSWAV